MRKKKKTQNNLNQVIKVIALSMNRTSKTLMRGKGGKWFASAIKANVVIAMLSVKCG